MIYNHYYDPTPAFTKFYIFGAGGFGREVAWLASRRWGTTIATEFVVTEEKFLVPAINNIKCTMLSEIIVDSNTRYAIAVGDPASRKKISMLCDSSNLLSTRVIHPLFEASKWIEIGNGTIICSGVIATTNIKIGCHVQINLSCTIGHDVEIGNYTTLSPGVHISGNVVIGSGVFIGTGANIINGSSQSPITIGENSVIAAGACVTKSVEPNSMVAGVPAVKKR